MRCRWAWPRWIHRLITWWVAQLAIMLISMKAKSSTFSSIRYQTWTRSITVWAAARAPVSFAITMKVQMWINLALVRVRRSASEMLITTLRAQRLKSPTRLCREQLEGRTITMGATSSINTIRQWMSRIGQVWWTHRGNFLEACTLLSTLINHRVASVKIMINRNHGRIELTSNRSHVTNPDNHTSQRVALSSSKKSSKLALIRWILL